MSAKRTVLLAEPQAATRWGWKREFERADFTVFTAAHGDDLARCLSENAPDALVLDRRMAGPSGEVVRRLREDAGRCPATCFVMALLSSEADRQLLLRAGADWYVEKGALVSSLALAVRAEVEPAPLLAVSPRQLDRRVLVTLPVEYCHARRVAAGAMLNLSQGGIFIRTPQPAEAGSRLLLRFSLPGRRAWECFGRVAWVRRPEDDHFYPPGMGVQFLDLEAEARATLAEFVGAVRDAPGLAGLGAGCAQST